MSYEDVKNKKYQKVEYVHSLENPVRKILLERVLNGSPSIGAYTMLLEIIFGIDGGWFFDAPPCNNHDVPMYFLKKLYCEFVLGEIPNYFDILPSQGRGGGSLFERPRARRDPNIIRALVVKP